MKMGDNVCAGRVASKTVPQIVVADNNICIEDKTTKHKQKVTYCPLSLP